MKLARLLFSKAERLATAVQKVGVSAEDVMTAANAIVTVAAEMTASLMLSSRQL